MSVQKQTTKFDKKSQLGRLLFWVTWPGIWLTLKSSPPRTRVVLHYKGQVLVLRNWLGTGEWGLPGGGLHRGEEPVAGGVREVAEEVGLTLKPSDLHELGRYHLRSSGIKIRYVAFWVECRTKPAIVVDGKEVVAAQWVDLDKLEEYPLTSSARHILLAFSNRSNLVE